MLSYCGGLECLMLPPGLLPSLPLLLPSRQSRLRASLGLCGGPRKPLPNMFSVLSALTSKCPISPLALDSMEELGDCLSTWELRILEIRQRMSQTLFLLQLSGMSFLKARIIPTHSFHLRNRSLSRTTRLSCVKNNSRFLLEKNKTLSPGPRNSG